MLEKFLVLLERFVVAHELIAANSDKSQGKVYFSEEETKEKMDKFVEEKKKEVEKAAPKKAPKKTAKPEPEDDDLADDEEDEKPAPKKTAKTKAKPEVDLDALREEIKTMAEAIGEGDSDECADNFDDMLDDFGARNIGKIKDEDVAEFHGLLKEMVVKYYDVTED